jgi:hypothetical protein
METKNFFPIPTDRFYKAFPFVGLSICALSIYLIIQREQKDDALDRAYIDKHINTTKEAEEDKARFEKNSFDYLLYKEIFEMKYKVNYASLRNDSALLKNNLQDKFAIPIDFDCFRADMIQLNQLKYQVDSLYALIDMDNRIIKAAPIERSLFQTWVVPSIGIALAGVSGFFIAFWGFGLWYRVEPKELDSKEAKTETK